MNYESVQVVRHGVVSAVDVADAIDCAYRLRQNLSDRDVELCTTAQAI
ncbi:hypothetical protein [Streptomyces cucumeris]|nr:hypothetical protein [Streptomyces sp. NEAU-Y11]MCP9207186.1 hypothetical protein [Streptomyces sp. NEAU-Y11]